MIRCMIHVCMIMYTLCKSVSMGATTVPTCPRRAITHIPFCPVYAYSITRSPPHGLHLTC